MGADKPQLPITLKVDTDRVLSVAYSPDGKTLAAGNADKTIKLWDVATGKDTATFGSKEAGNLHAYGVYSVAYSPDGKTLAAGSMDKTIKLWDVATGKEQATLQGHTKYVSSVAFSPDGKTLASGSGDATIKLWDVATGKEQATLKGHGFFGCRPWLSVRTARRWPRLARTTRSNCGTWRRARSRPPSTGSPNPASAPSHLAYSPDGKTLAEGTGIFDEGKRGFSGEVKLWDVATGKEQATLLLGDTGGFGYTGGVNSVAYSPDGKTLAAASVCTIKLWDAATGKELATLQGQAGMVSSVAFSPNGKTLAAVNADKTIKLWDVATASRPVGPAAVPVPAAPSPKLSDLFPGCTVEYEGTQVFLRDASGHRKPMPDGDYPLYNGTYILHVRGGVKVSQN